MVSTSAPAEALVEAPLISEAPSPELTIEGRRPASLVAKRIFDVLVSVSAVILLAPLWLLFVLGIKLDSRGPVLYRQLRVGRDGRIFGMLKFRTMVDGAHARRAELGHLNQAPDGLFKITADPRVTRFGRFLRATSLDELPQLLHVVTGEMSLVGPRPLIPEEDELIEGVYRRRLEVAPGMTGPWQAAGASTIPMTEMMELDCDYIASRSLPGDVVILIRTIPHVLLGRGV